MKPVLGGMEILDAFVLRYKGQLCKSKLASERNSQGKGLASTGIGKGQSHPPGRYLMDVKLGTWFSGGLSSAGGTVGLHDLRGLFKSKGFCDSENM